MNPSPTRSQAPGGGDGAAGARAPGRGRAAAAGGQRPGLRGSDPKGSGVELGAPVVGSERLKGCLGKKIIKY